MRLLALDPGESTGYCVWSEALNAAAWGTIKYDSVPKISYTPDGHDPMRYLRDALRSLRQTWECEIVVVERLPVTLSKTMQAIVATVNEIFPVGEHHYARHDVSPGEWKPVTRHVQVPFPAKTQHERDAFRLGYYWMAKRGLVSL